MFIANKCDNSRLEKSVVDFLALGYGEPTIVSVNARRNRDEMVGKILEVLPDKMAEPDELVEPEMKVAIVGRRNVGKSTFVNTLTESDRMIVSEVAGTTRDSVNIRFEMDNKSFLAIDTPGLRRGKSVRTGNRLLRNTPSQAVDPVCRCNVDVFRRLIAYQQSGSSTLQLHRRQLQAVYPGRQQMGFDGGPHGDGAVEPITFTTIFRRYGMCRSPSLLARRGGTARSFSIMRKCSSSNR